MSKPSASSVRPKTGVIGLGRMGTAIARQLAISSDVVGWDVQAGARQKLEAEGLTILSPEELAAECDSFLLCLSTPHATREVVNALVPLLKPGVVLVDTSTSDPTTAQELAQVVATYGAYFLDAPILGRPSTCGQWTLPVGGNAQALEHVKPQLGQLAARIYHVGEVGAGHTIKLLNNIMFAAINAVTAEVIGACEYLDVDPKQFYDIISESAAATVSPLFLELVPSMTEDDPKSVFTVALLQKDIRLAANMCESHNVPLLLTRALQAIADLAVAQGLGDQDSAALVRLYRKRS